MISRNALSKPFIPLLAQTAGAHRKPRWLPVAKSKIYRIPKRPEVSEEERLELLRLNNNYNTQMRAIKKFYYTEMVKEKLTTESASSEMSIKLEAEDWERCVQLNDEWNKQVASERKERRKVEVQSLEEYALQRMIKKDQEMKQIIEKASDAVKREKVRFSKQKIYHRKQEIPFKLACLKLVCVRFASLHSKIRSLPW